MQNNNENNHANEPLPNYGKDIVFFKSFEEMNEYDHQQMASHSPLQRLQNITGMIKQMYAEELSHEMKNLVLQFK